MVKRDHELVPVHQIMSRTEVNALLSKMNIVVNNLPVIKVTDPQAKKAEAKVGDVLTIEREDFGKRYTYYRRVVP